jgi:hypothetical protein
MARAIFNISLHVLSRLAACAGGLWADPIAVRFPGGLAVPADGRSPICGPIWLPLRRWFPGPSAGGSNAHLRMVPVAHLRKNTAAHRGWIRLPIRPAHL